MHPWLNVDLKEFADAFLLSRWVGIMEKNL